MSEPYFDPRLSAVDLLEWFEDREATGRPVQGELLAAFEAALARTDFRTYDADP